MSISRRSLVLPALAASVALVAACSDLQLVQVGGQGGATTSASSTGPSSNGSTGTGGATSSSGTTSSSTSASSTCGATSSSTSAGAPLLGYEQMGAFIDSNNPGQANISKYQAVGSGMVGQLTVYYVDGTTTELIVGLYDDDNGNPNHLLTKGVIDNPVANGWNTAPVCPVNVTQNAWYWIALLAPATTNGGTFEFGFDQVPGLDGKQSASSSLSDLPNPWGSSASADLPDTECSFYASP